VSFVFDLSSQQALADAANFITYLKTIYPGITEVITFGGSYPGNLAAWFRIKYPHLTKGAIASSAPVQAELDMVQYLDVVEESLASIAGIECDNAIQQATQIVQQMLTTSDGRSTLQKRFQTCEPIVSDNDVANFMSDLMGNWMGVVQYNNESPMSPTIEDLCEIMENNTIPSVFDRYVTVANLFVGDDPACVDISYTNMIEQLQNISQFGESGVGMRQWTYQTCVEFGYFQSTDSPNQPFGNLVPLSFYTDMCYDIFGFKFLPKINQTNAEYGGNTPEATNIVFVNGSIDPWHSLSILESLSDSVIAIYIEGTAHCANMLPARPSDPPGLALAQQQIQGIIHSWLM